MDIRYYNIRIVSILTALFIILALCGTASAAQLYVNETGWWNEGGSFNSSSTPIQSAINNATTGDTLIVNSGTYYENVNVTKTLTLRGNDSNPTQPVVDAMQADHAINISADGVTLDGFIATNATISEEGSEQIGIVVISDNNVIVNNNATSNFAGIVLFDSSNNNLTDNTASLNDYGIVLFDSSNNNLTGNDASLNSDFGIFLDYSDYNNLTENNASLNYVGIFLNMSIGNNLTSNIANDNTDNGIFLITSNSNNLTNNDANINSHGIYLDSSNDNTITDNDVNDNTAQGIVLNSAYSNTIEDNQVNSNAYNGILIEFSSHNNNISGNIVNENGDRGILLDNSSNNNVTYNNASYNGGGILLVTGSQNNLIANNVISNNSNFGIDLSHSTTDNNRIYYNTVMGNINGINLNFSNSNIITGNTLTHNNENGIRLDNSNDNTITDNTINWNNDSGICIGDSSNNNTLVNNTVNENSGTGICLSESNSNTITSNSVNSNHCDGIFLDNSSDNIIAGNIVNENSDCGISLLFSNNNNITENNVSNNYNGGIPLTSSHNNLIYHNNLINNSQNAYDDMGNNSWDNGYPSGGNYWSDYTGVDNYSGAGQDQSGSDGIGDTPYTISGSGGAQDSYPFMQTNGWMQDVLLVFSITPSSRNAQIGTPVTLFMSVINAGTASATGVSISQASDLPVTLSYQTWNGTALTGSSDTPVVIGPVEAVHYVLTINATAEFASSPMTFDVSCTNGATAPISGVNTLMLSASATPYADVIMMSTSLDMSTAVNTAMAFAIATTNVGGAEATGVSLIMEVPSTISGLAYQVNETNPDGTIKGPAAGLTIPVGGQPTFAVFLTPTQAIDYDPANNRIVLKLVDGSGKVIGAQSVAVSAV